MRFFAPAPPLSRAPTPAPTPRPSTLTLSALSPFLGPRSPTPAPTPASTAYARLDSILGLARLSAWRAPDDPLAQGRERLLTQAFAAASPRPSPATSSGQRGFKNPTRLAQRPPHPPGRRVVPLQRRRSGAAVEDRGIHRRRSDQSYAPEV